jgi:hypothetical protein
MEYQNEEFEWINNANEQLLKLVGPGKSNFDLKDKEYEQIGEINTTFFFKRSQIAAVTSTAEFFSGKLESELTNGLEWYIFESNSKVNLLANDFTRQIDRIGVDFLNTNVPEMPLTLERNNIVGLCLETKILAKLGYFWNGVIK